MDLKKSNFCIITPGTFCDLALSLKDYNGVHRRRKRTRDLLHDDGDS
jgi:hypothetical protein